MKMWSFVATTSSRGPPRWPTRGSSGQTILLRVAFFLATACGETLYSVLFVDLTISCCRVGSVESSKFRSCSICAIILLEQTGVTN